jgi:hypothetical protein
VRRLFVTLAASVALTFAAALPIKATGLTLATVSCTDGDSFSATVDTDALTDLTQAIEAMTLYPAGLSCTLATAPLLTSMGGVASAWKASGFVVGGGRFQLFCPAETGVPDQKFWVNFGLSAHDRDGGTDVKGGTFNLAVPDGPTQCDGPSNFTSKPYCLVINNEPPGPPSSPWYAWINSTVTQAHGDYFGSLEGQDIGVAVKDTGNPGHQNSPDRIAPRTDGRTTSCPEIGDPPLDTVDESEWTDVLNGNITIHPQSQL